MKVFKAIPELLTRLTLGYVFVESGIGKIQNLSKVINFFQSLNIPLPQIQAPLVALIELIGGVLLMIGLFTRISASLLALIMVVALYTAKWEDIHNVSDLFGTLEFMYFIALIWLVERGANVLSVKKIKSES